jgi:hypothetical protein
MPIRTVPGTDVQYYLIAFDKRGAEREDGGDLLSERIVRELRGGAYTDVFLFSHGWKGDVPAAIEQYDAWIGAMLGCTADRERARLVRPGFKALLIGFHWPSLPFGDEELGAGAAFALMAEGAASAAGGDPATAAVGAGATEPLVETWADRIADTPAAREALRTIFAAAARDIEPDRMPPEVVRAYLTLDRESGLGAEGPAGAPDADREPFDPVASYEDAKWEAEDFGGIGLGGLLAPLRQLSFWQMKARARTVGESGGHALLRSLRDAAGPEAHFHLMGHSFGCIVVSSIVAGPGGPDPVPVDTLFLVQGALSLWSYCSSIPALPGRPGYFHRVVRDGRVRGPVVTTHSRFDTAVRVLYPKAAGIAGQVEYDPAAKRFPKYGGVGTFGIQGEGVEVEDLPIGQTDARYNFQPGRIYNLDADSIIRNGGGASGAHSDIAHPEVAHAFWSAVLAGHSG